ncbi:MAG: TVP38/TMEM64 family protein [Gammaproteobacteria bacterium]
MDKVMPRGLIVAMVFAGLIAYIALGGEQWLSLAAFKAHRESLLQYTASHYGSMLLLSLLIYTAAIALSIPGAALLSLVTGFLFGRWVGTAVIVVAATLGGTLVFLAARYLVGDIARRRLEQHAAAAKVLHGFHEDAFHYLLFLRLVPLFPFWLVNLAPAFTRIRTRTYVIATAIGIVPGSFVFANLGQSLGRLDSLHNLLSREVIVAFVLLGALALAPVLLKKFRNKGVADGGS